MTSLKEILVPEYYVPNEAFVIAAEFRREASRVRELAAQSRATKGTLDGTWQGNAKNKFSADFDPRISGLDNYANMLEDKARQIESIRVVRWNKQIVKS